MKLKSVANDFSMWGLIACVAGASFFESFESE
jgi:hypothetical protein